MNRRDRRKFCLDLPWSGAYTGFADAAPPCQEESADLLKGGNDDTATRDGGAPSAGRSDGQRIPTPGTAAPTDDCGIMCDGCALGAGYEGTDYSENGAYNMTCYTMIPFCVACPPGLITSGNPVPAQEIATAVHLATGADVASIARRHRGRLQINAERGIVAVRGTPCDPDAIAAVIFLSPQKIFELEAMSVPLLAWAATLKSRTTVL